ncbi:MAG: hypothetical protein IBJ12_05440 [Sphingomonadaceae bacterium]|nr:hypothetical protein [Sphingomonadaceae bacterium]
MAIAMAAVIVAGFSTQYLTGRSTFAARPLVHMHGIAFMGWVALFVAQSWLATRGSMALHRTLGWIGAGWVVVMVLLSFLIIIDVTQRGTAPFFFLPQHFLIANPMTALVFALLTAAAIRMRRQSDWHMRLHISAMVAIIGPGFGRLLPMPLLVPYAFEVTGLVGMLFIVAGMVRDRIRLGHVHKAWWLGLAANLAVIPLSAAIVYSPVGDAIYAAVTAGHPGADLPGLEFSPPPL